MYVCMYALNPNFTKIPKYMSFVLHSMCFHQRSLHYGPNRCLHNQLFSNAQKMPKSNNTAHLSIEATTWTMERQRHTSNTEFDID